MRSTSTSHLDTDQVPECICIHAGILEVAGIILDLHQERHKDAVLVMTRCWANRTYVCEAPMLTEQLGTGKQRPDPGCCFKSQVGMRGCAYLQPLCIGLPAAVAKDGDDHKVVCQVYLLQ